MMAAVALLAACGDDAPGTLAPAERAPDAHALFRQIDRDGDGAITTRELASFFESVLGSVSLSAAAALLRTDNAEVDAEDSDDDLRADLGLPRGGPPVGRRRTACARAQIWGKAQYKAGSATCFD